MKKEESEHVSAAKVGTYGLIAAALITALAAVIVAIINSTHNQKQNGINSNISTAFNGNNANASAVNGNVQIHSGNNNQNSPLPPPPVSLPYKVDWGVLEKYFTISDIRKEKEPNMAETLSFVVQAKTSYNAFNALPLFKAEFLDSEGILIGPVGSTFVGYEPRHINWDAQARSRVSILLPTGAARSKLSLIRFSRVT